MERPSGPEDWRPCSREWRWRVISFGKHVVLLFHIESRDRWDREEIPPERRLLQIALTPARDWSLLNGYGTPSLSNDFAKGFIIFQLSASSLKSYYESTIRRASPDILGTCGWPSRESYKLTERDCRTIRTHFIDLLLTSFRCFNQASKLLLPRKGSTPGNSGSSWFDEGALQTPQKVSPLNRLESVKSGQPLSPVSWKQ